MKRKEIRTSFDCIGSGRRSPSRPQPHRRRYFNKEKRVLLQLVASGVANGSLYALIALGMTVLFRTTNLINLAHGEFAMAAAYFTFAGVTVLEIPYAAAALGAFALLVLIGLAIERGLIRPLA